MPPRVVVDPGSHELMNLGDIAMLDVALGRVRELWPDAELQVLTADPGRLARYEPDAVPLPAAGRYDMTSAHVAVLAEADLLLVTGRGGTNDAFLAESLQLLDEVEAAIDAGTPVALTGQGVGPVRDARLVARAGEVLPRVGLIAVREQRLAVPLLEALGVPGERVVVTGDDALEPAWSARPEAFGRTGIGLSVRVAGYAAVGADEAAAVGRAVRAAAAERGSEVVPLPISLYPHEDEHATLAHLAGSNGQPVETVEEAVARAGRCRVVVAGSYHAAVFAVAQGVPAVCLTRSPYYAAKMEGLRDLFGAGVAVVPIGGRLFEERLAAAIGAAWETPDAGRAALVREAERQIAGGRAAYGRLAELAGAARVG